MSDFIEIGDSGLVAIENGWFLHVPTGNRVSPDGYVYDKKGELIWSPEIYDEYER